MSKKIPAHSRAPVPGLSLASPFFGESPQALVLIEADIVHIQQDQPRTIAQEIDDAIILVPAISRATVAYGVTFFDDFQIQRPNGLRPLNFHFDAEDGQLDRTDRHVLLALETNYAEINEVFRILEALKHVINNPLIHLGLSLPSTRDHLGFADGTSNLQELAATDFEQTVFVQEEDDPLYSGGTYLVFRKYREEVYLWHQLPIEVQEQFIGRRRGNGAFLDGDHTFTNSTWHATPLFSHIRCANPRTQGLTFVNWRDRMFRRSIPYTTRLPSGEEERGLLFLALARDPREQVERIHNTQMQPKSGRRDLLLSTGYVVPLRSTCYFFHHPPGVGITKGVS